MNSPSETAEHCENSLGKEIKLLEEYPVANTFIQFSAPRSTSLEKFLAKRETQSCPGSRMVSVDEEESVTEWPATRGPSLEEKAPSRMASVDEEPTQWPATRGPSLEEESRCQANRMIPVQTDCIQFPASWENPVAPMQFLGECGMGDSLDVNEMAWDPSQWQLDPPSSVGFLQNASVENDFVVKPVSRTTPWPVNWEPFLQPVTVSSDSPSDFAFPVDHISVLGEAQQPMQAGQFAACPTSQNLAKWDAMNEMSKEKDPLFEKIMERDPLLEKFMMNKNISAVGSGSACGDSTAASSGDGEAVRELLLPKGMFEEASHNSEADSSPLHPSIVDNQIYSALGPDDTWWQSDDLQDKSGTLKLNLTYSLGMWSIGSAKHATGDCKPCGFLWKKGCHKAQNCQFCHLCKSDEVKKRKRDKIALRRREEEMMWQCGENEEPMPHETPRVLPGLRQ